MPSFLSRFDLTIGQPASIFDLHKPIDTLPPYESYSYAEAPAKTASAPIAMMISNCNAGNDRNSYIKELSQHVDVHSYGSCMHNKNVDPDTLKSLGKEADGQYDYDVKLATRKWEKGAWAHVDYTRP